MQNLIAEARDAIGPPPRRFGFLSRYRLRVRPPSWMPKTDELREVYRQQSLLLRRGDVVWGALVQANTLLFKPGPTDHPAMAVYAPTRDLDDSPYVLQGIARHLFRLKGTTPKGPAERRLAAMITNEMERGLGWVVPKSCTGGLDVRSTSFMVFRGHLPAGRLESGWFPLLAHPDTPAVMILPARYWPPALVRRWCGVSAA